MMSDEESDIAEVQKTLVLTDEVAVDTPLKYSDSTPLPTTHDPSAHCTPSGQSSETPPSPLSCKGAILEFSEAQDSSTPMRFTTRVALETGVSRPIKSLLQEELNDSIKVSDDWAHSLYATVANSEEIEEYLQKSGKYNNSRWMLPCTPAKEEELYVPYCEIFNSILQRFGMGGRRRAIDTHTTQLNHRTDPISMKPTTHHSSPDISVQAYGPSFTAPSSGAQVGFPNMATHFDGKLDGQAKNNHLIQMGTYARQTFAHQPNRFFVRSLIITEHRAQLFHFDRSGAQYTELFDIHEHPHTFVRLVLGLCAVDEQLLGLDDSLHWTTGRGGKRTSGTLKTVDGDNQATEHDLILSEPPLHRSSIQGRGTVCWPVMERVSGRRLLVKDYWMSEGRIPEFELLKEVKCLKGVSQMVAYEEGRGQTKFFRGDIGSINSKKFHNRKAIRIILEVYGKSIDKFSSAEEFLGAFRDAIAAHGRLLSKKILHRDICNTNILCRKTPTARWRSLPPAATHAGPVCIATKGKTVAPAVASPLDSRWHSVAINRSQPSQTGRPRNHHWTGRSDFSDIIGPSPKKVGYRGILIDLDMAIKAGRLISEICKDFRTGNPIFYSTAILEGLSMDVKDRPAHDYLDDLEMFFWIFDYLMFTRKTNGEKAEIKEMQNTIISWCRVEEPAEAHSAKWTFITKTVRAEMVKKSLDESWHSISVDLFLKFKDYMRKLCIEKEKLTGSKMEPYLDGIVPNRFSPILKNVDKHYTYILGLFDEALEKAVEVARAPRITAGPVLEKPQTLSFPPVPPLFMLQSQVARGSKRRTDDAESDLDESPTKPGKRLKFPAGQINGQVPSSQSQSAPNSLNQDRML
ncbi:hypothetical protein EST38_g8802 [Candolleomyces aberdarensis]|uniref:Fungal-type protein kinase domain-containing protein n=1 Tax=Candolleomyces aberdarensis TaxID=2316362 RepID=A0A4Q2DEV3_9AGAR|nr:hypothetical protein EST38_g8802 [Candolleomyces aberdarensis]